MAMSDSSASANLLTTLSQGHEKGKDHVGENHLHRLSQFLSAFFMSWLLFSASSLQPISLNRILKIYTCGSFTYEILNVRNKGLIKNG